MKDSGKRSERSRRRLARRTWDTILNMVTLSHSLDIPKAERSRNFSETDIISAECGFSARTYLYRIFKLKEGCTPAEWREKMAENVAAEGKKQD
ncbi:AraC family transcriptional regulator [Segatella copri]|nr:AraC family transcriptional regulator [Segatella copri]